MAKDYSAIKRLSSEIERIMATPIERSHINETLDYLNQYERKITAETQSGIKATREQAASLPEEWSVEAEFEDRGAGYAGIVALITWFGFFIYLYLSIETFFFVVILSIIPGCIFAAVVWVLFGFIFGRSDDKRHAAETQQMRNNLKHDKTTLLNLETEAWQVHENVIASLNRMRTWLSQGAREEYEFLIRRSNELVATIDYEVKINVDPDNTESQGHPVIEWYSRQLETNIDALFHMSEEDKLDQDRLMEMGGKLKLLPFFEDGIAGEIKVYSNSGGMLYDQFAKQAGLLHRSSIESHGLFVDQATPAGHTLNYYLVIEVRYVVSVPDGKGFFSHQERVDEHLVHSERITTPRVFTEGEKLERDIAERTLWKKREEFDEQVSRDDQKNNPDQSSALDDVLALTKRRMAMEQERNQAVIRLREELTQAGATEEIIEEAVEELLHRYAQQD